MSMLKKTAALTVSAVLLLQPMTASAVTWNNIVNGLRNSGSNRYTEDGTTIEKDGENYTISGGTITGDNGASINKNYFGDHANVFLKNLIVDKAVSVNAHDGTQIRVEIDQDTMIKKWISGIVDGAGSSITIVNNGNIGAATGWAKDGGYISMTNNGIAGVSVDGQADGKDSVVEIENTENGVTKGMAIGASGQGAKVSAVNNGSINGAKKDDKGTTTITRAIGIGGTDDFDAENSGYILEFTNNGNVSGQVDIYLGNGTSVLNNNGTVDKELFYEENVNVLEGTSIEEILQRVDGMLVGDYFDVNEYAKNEYDEWEVVRSYSVGDEPENPDDSEDPENPEQPETPEQPEATQQPTIEVSKYDQERHEMEEKRKEEAIGGVYGSPYWVKQLYLGYHSLNLRLFVGEQQSNFKQSLSWMPDSTKQLALRVNTDAPEKLTMRLDEKALETLERTEFSVITLLDKSGNAVMQYSLTDLRSVYDQYGLSGDDQMVVGGANDDVMKIVNGEMKPIEA